MLGFTEREGFKLHQASHQCGVIYKNIGMGREYGENKRCWMDVVY